MGNFHTKTYLTVMRLRADAQSTRLDFRDLLVARDDEGVLEVTDEQGSTWRYTREHLDNPFYDKDTRDWHYYGFSDDLDRERVARELSRVALGDLADERMRVTHTEANVRALFDELVAAALDALESR